MVQGYRRTRDDTCVVRGSKYFYIWKIGILMPDFLSLTVRLTHNRLSSLRLSYSRPMESAMSYRSLLDVVEMGLYFEVV
jgi:hypothetical protein